MAAAEPKQADEAPGRDATPGTAVRRVTIPATISPVLQGFPDLDHRVWILALGRFVITAGFAMVMPFLAMHLAVERDIPLMQIGALWTVSGG